MGVCVLCSQMNCSSVFHFIIVFPTSSLTRIWDAEFSQRPTMTLHPCEILSSLTVGGASEKDVSCEWLSEMARLSEPDPGMALFESFQSTELLSGVSRIGSQRYLRHERACSTITGVEEEEGYWPPQGHSGLSWWRQVDRTFAMRTRNRTLPAIPVSLDGDSFPNGLFLLWDTPSRESAEIPPPQSSDM